MRWRKAAKKSGSPLREFVYLDDISVYSLVASQVGLIVTELSETQATSMQSDVGASFGGGAGGVVKAKIGSRMQSSESQSSQVLRKAIIQTTFRDLYEHNMKALKLRPRDGEPVTTLIDSLSGLERTAREGNASSLLVDPLLLERGELVEMEVQLDAEPIFRTGAVLADLLGIVQEDPGMFGIQDPAGLGQMASISRLLDRVMVGLVPVRGLAVDYEVVELNGKEWLVHRLLLAGIDIPADKRRALYLVGVAEQALFWKDIRRVLFSGSTYRVLARISRSSIAESWTPVKLADVLGDFVPDFAPTLENANRGFIAAMKSREGEIDGSPSTNVRATLVAYADLLSGELDVDLPEDEMQHAGLLDVGDFDPSRSTRDWRDLFNPVTAAIAARAGHDVDPAVASNCRLAARIQVGLTPAIGAHADTSTIDEQPANGDRFLDTELIAIYW